MRSGEGELLPCRETAHGRAWHVRHTLPVPNPGSAAEVYRDVLERFPTSAVGPEAQYFLAVSLYKSTHQASALLNHWQQLQTRYPESVWRLKQSCIEKGK